MKYYYNYDEDLRIYDDNNDTNSIGLTEAEQYAVDELGFTIKGIGKDGTLTDNQMDIIETIKEAYFESYHNDWFIRDDTKTYEDEDRFSHDDDEFWARVDIAYQDYVDEKLERENEENKED